MADCLWLEDPVEPLPRPAWSGRADVMTFDEDGKLTRKDSFVKIRELA